MTGAPDGAEVIENNPPEEARCPKVPAIPVLPTLSEMLAHRVTHLPYRAWCIDCVEAFARKMGHHAAALDQREFPLISVDDFLLSSGGVVTRALFACGLQPETASIVRVGSGAFSRCTC